ncbi:MAG: hypothetical protein ACREVR_06640 [Burkholderiales bacterium]
MPIAMTFQEFRHMHRALLPGESLPRLPTLLERLQVLLSAPLRHGAEAEENAPEPEEGQEEEWPESS